MYKVLKKCLKCNGWCKTLPLKKKKKQISFSCLRTMTLTPFPFSFPSELIICKEDTYIQKTDLPNTCMCILKPDIIIN